MSTLQDKIYLSPAETARLLLVSPVTLRAWAQKGLLPSETTPGGHRRFLREDVERFLRNRGQPPPLRVLIVEDDAMMRDFLVELLRDLSPPPLVETAQDGFEAGLKVQGFAPDVVLLDLMMPGLNGFETCRQIKANLASAATRILAMTGFPSEENVAKILAAGAEICLNKPLDTEQLLRLLTPGLGGADTRK
ncbi:MAG: hypothetical protein BWK76_18120 [Desulfobulbaceae bacterium A2]|nr:MAG: hypothetical protein BWK76_18120 [Desulfobulbaceae bacterium A2]